MVRDTKVLLLVTAGPGSLGVAVGDKGMENSQSICLLSDSLCLSPACWY